MSADGTTFDVRVYRTEVYKGVEVTTYKVRWKVGATTLARRPPSSAFPRISSDSPA
jgi:hypothetical protein